MVKRIYTGGLIGNPAHRVVSDNPEQYVGHPNPAIDARWDSLLSSLEVLVPRPLAATAFSGALNTSASGSSPSLYRVTLDVIHQLHCLNQVRMRIDHTYYYPDLPPDFQRSHIDHCIDHIRQALQCHADLTPLGLIADEDPRYSETVYNVPHTCRDFERLREWAKERENPDLTM